MKKNDIFIMIPTGDRPQKALAVAKAWDSVGISVIAYCWDDETYELLKPIALHLYRGERKSFAVLQNFMAKETNGWKCMICGADDLYPSKTKHLPRLAELYDGKILWVRDGLFNEGLTHAVITRKWYDNNNSIFDERFEHAYCDIDLMVTTSRRNEVVKCFTIEFDHRHYLKTKEKPDKIYQIALDASPADLKRFRDKYKDTNTFLGFVPIHKEYECPMISNYVS